MPKKKHVRRKTVKKEGFSLSRNHILMIVGVVVVALFIVSVVRGYWGILVSSEPMNSIYGKGIAINDNNEVLIYGGNNQFDRQRPIIWKDQLLYDVQSGLSQSFTFTINKQAGIQAGNPNVFNNKTEFVGTDSPFGVPQAFIWRPVGGVRFLDNAPANTKTYADAVNNVSQVVGHYQSNTGDPCMHLFVWQDGNWNMLDNSNLLCKVMATDINDNGVITGITFPNTINDGRKAFMLDSNTGAYAEIGSPSFNNVFPWTINSSNNVVGYAMPINSTANNPIAFLWSNGVYTSLGTLGGTRSVAYSINNNGIIAGESNVKTDTNEFHAFVIEEFRGNGPNMVDLGVLDVIPGVTTWGSTALSINTIGIIVGTNYVFNSLTPADPATGNYQYYQIPVSWDYVLTKIKKPKNFRNPNITDVPIPTAYQSPTPVIPIVTAAP